MALSADEFNKKIAPLIKALHTACIENNVYMFAAIEVETEDKGASTQSQVLAAAHITSETCSPLKAAYFVVNGDMTKAIVEMSGAEMVAQVDSGDARVS